MNYEKYNKNDIVYLPDDIESKHKYYIIDRNCNNGWLDTNGKFYPILAFHESFAEMYVKKHYSVKLNEEKSKKKHIFYKDFLTDKMGWILIDTILGYKETYIYISPYHKITKSQFEFLYDFLYKRQIWDELKRIMSLMED